MYKTSVFHNQYFSNDSNKGSDEIIIYSNLNFKIDICNQNVEYYYFSHLS